MPAAFLLLLQAEHQRLPSLLLRRDGVKYLGLLFAVEDADDAFG